MANRHQLFCFTDFFLNCNLWKEDFKKKLNIRYAYAGWEECPTTGRKHLQGWFYLNEKTSYEVVRKKLKGRTVFIANGDSTSQEVYCTKEENIAFEYGIKPAPGTRNDLRKFDELIRTPGITEKEIFEINPDYYIRYNKGVGKVLSLYAPKRNWEMDVRIYWGKPGSGKTKAAWDEFGVDNVYPKMTGKWWDHYNGETCVLIDDFDPDNCFDLVFDWYLKLLDRYPIFVEYKGGSTSFRSKTIIFTSNFNPDYWFRDKDNRSAFFRRVKLIKEFK